MKLEYASPAWEKAKTSEKVKYLRGCYGWPDHKDKLCFGTLEDMIFAEIYKEVKKMEASL